MDISYIITPFFAWLITGCTKFVLNSYQSRRLAFDLIGYGGMPSNHTSIVASAAAIIYFNEGIHEPALVVAVALVFIVALDAHSLRRQVGKHAEAINRLNQSSETKLRERMGHTWLELVAGVATGIVAAWTVWHLAG